MNNEDEEEDAEKEELNKNRETRSARDRVGVWFEE